MPEAPGTEGKTLLYSLDIPSVHPPHIPRHFHRQNVFHRLALYLSALVNLYSFYSIYHLLVRSLWQFCKLSSYMLRLCTIEAVFLMFFITFQTEPCVIVFLDKCYSHLLFMWGPNNSTSTKEQFQYDFIFLHTTAPHPKIVTLIFSKFLGHTAEWFWTYFSNFVIYL